MTHEEFVERTKEALECEREGEIGEAVSKIRALLKDVVPAVEAGVNDWHHQQALSLLVNALASTERTAECQAAWNELIEFNKDQLKYWETALASSHEHFNTWNDAKLSKD